LLLPAGISNGLLQEWPKVQKCRLALANVLELPHPSPPADAQQQQQQQEQQSQAAMGEHQLPDNVHKAAGGANGPNAASSMSGTPAAVTAADGQPSSEHAVAAVAAAEAAAAADDELLWPVLFHAMGDSQMVPPEQEVPLTGVREHLDRRLSSVFIEPFEMQVCVDRCHLSPVEYGVRGACMHACV
jgi:uncharacterized protein with NRDE domain